MLQPNPEYSKLLLMWQMCRAAAGGDYAVKNYPLIKKTVPKLSGQSDEDYKDMLNRGVFFNATGRTLEGLLGMAFRKEVIAEYPAQMQSVIDDMTLAKDMSINLTDFCERALSEDLTVGRVGYLIEYPASSTEGMSLAAVNRLNIRPYVAEYRAESILDWSFDRINNAAQLSSVRLTESVEELTVDFERKIIEQERRLLLIDGVYVQRIYRDEKQFGDDIVPLMQGRPLNFIPFVCDFWTAKAPIYDLACVNLSHFMTTVDREHGAHYTAIPTPMFAGFTFDDGEAFQLGATGGYASQNPDAKWGYLEFTGSGLTTLKEIGEEKKQDMIILGARFLQSEKNAAEAENTVKIRRSGETSVLAAAAKRRSRSVTRILEIMRDWMGITGEINVEINTDYTEAGITAQDLQALVASWQSGAISHQTLYYNLKHGEMYEEGTTFEDEQERINTQSINLSSAPAVESN